LAGTIVGSNDASLDGVPDSEGKGFSPQPEHAIANCSHLVNTDAELGGLVAAISTFAKLLWCLLFLLLGSRQ